MEVEVFINMGMCRHLVGTSPFPLNVVKKSAHLIDNKKKILNLQ